MPVNIYEEESRNRVTWLCGGNWNLQVNIEGLIGMASKEQGNNQQRTLHC